MCDCMQMAIYWRGVIKSAVKSASKFSFVAMKKTNSRHDSCLACNLIPIGSQVSFYREKSSGCLFQCVFYVWVLFSTVKKKSWNFKIFIYRRGRLKKRGEKEKWTGGNCWYFVFYRFFCCTAGTCAICYVYTCRARARRNVYRRCFMMKTCPLIFLSLWLNSSRFVPWTMV